MVAGVHREAVVIPQSRAGPIVLTGDVSGGTVLAGSTVVSGSWVQRGSSKIYTLSLPQGTTTDQVFVDGKMAFESRWPNTDLISVLTEGAWGVSANSSAPSLRPELDELGFVSDPNLAESGLNYTGALLTLNAGTRGECKQSPPQT